MMAGDRTIFDEPHHQSLEFLAAQALAEGNSAGAFKFADRRCRILPLPDPHCYVLRSEASFQLGAKSAAIADLVTALQIAPDNIPANRRMLAWAHGAQQRQAAFALLGHDRNFDALRKAIGVLSANGQRYFSSVTVLDEAIEGWAIWQEDAPLEVVISDGTDTVSEMMEADAFHPLGDYGHAINFIVRRPRSTRSQSIELLIAGKVFHSVRAASNVAMPKLRVHRPRPDTRDQRVTVIVPVYGDYDSTRRCLESLLREMGASRHRAILVNDATPDAAIAKYLTGIQDESCVEVLTNARNLGFIGSVNRALSCIEQGDIIILNSDTIVPPCFIDRLAGAAQLSPDIGTVTPLSNNGEFVSFPVPFTSNPLGSREDVERIDSIAATHNAGKIVDIPSGIGFCLYVTRACLDRVGPLSNDFGAGYLEDADFCMRAREHGFRNVCATSVYVGHAGSKSFRQEKRALVVRNLSILELRFPKHRPECAAFMAADPLRAARQAIERVAAATATHPRLLVTGAGAIGAIARARARELASEAQSVMVFEVRHAIDGATVKIIDVAGGMPQSLVFNLSAPRECETLAEFTKALKPSRIEFLDPANAPPALLNLLVKLKVPYDIFVADAGLLGPPTAQPCAAAVHSLLHSDTGFDDDASKTDASTGASNWADRWREIADGAQCILAPCPQAEAFAANVLPRHKIEKVGLTRESSGQAKRRRQKTAARRLGFVPLRSCGHEQWLMSEVARGFHTIRPDIAITVIGTALDDMGLMRSANAFVTGAVNAEEFERLVEAHDLRYLFISATRPLFAHPVQSAALSCSLPTAYFDWSMGRIEPKRKDLPLDPRASLDDIMGALSEWMPAS
jgi:GT2 family glycosyltransferase